MYRPKSLRKNAIRFFCFISFCFISQVNLAQNAAENVRLESNKSLEREISGERERHVYLVSLTANQYAKITIIQQSVDVAARVSAADGKLIADIDAEATKGNETEVIELVAESSGDYRIEIKAALPKAVIGKYTVQLSETRGATVTDKALDAARRDSYESVRRKDAGNFDQAIEVAVRALETREKIPEANQKEIVPLLLNLSNLYIAKNNLAQAEIFQRRASETAEKEVGAESLLCADSLSVLARIRQNQANYAEAELNHKKALDMRTNLAGKKSLAAAESLQNLAVLYRAINDYPKAAENFTKALAIYEELLGNNRVEMASLLNNFGLFHYGAGDFKTAATLLLRSLTVKEKIFPANHRQIGVAYNNLGLVEWKNKDYDKAKEYYLRALKIFEIVNGPESDGVANILGNLGVIYKESDEDLTKAEQYYKRALAITEKNFGEYHQSTATSLTSLAILYRTMGDLDRAEQHQRRAQAIFESISSKYNHYSILSLGHLVRISAAKGDAAQAIEHLQKLSEIHEKIIPLNLSIGSERQKIAYFKQTSRFDNTITLHVETAPENAQMRDLAVTTLLQYKGRVLDAVSENLSSLQTRLAPEDRKLLDDLDDVNSRLSKTLLSNRQSLPDEEKAKQTESLEGEREKLEGEISRRSAGFYAPSQPVTLDRVRAAIPKDAALVEFAVYRPFKWKAKQSEPDKGEPRYAAYIVRQNGDVKWKELGDAKTINAAINEFREALRDPKRTDTEKIARRVDEKIMQPIRSLTGDAAHLLISPDGALNLMPFEALIDENGRYLIENYSFSYLTSGRELLRMQTTRESKSKSLIIANPSFGSPPAEKNAKADTTEKEAGRSKNRRNNTAAENENETLFAPLGATIAEARSIQSLFPSATVLTGAQATESALKQSVAPRILHIASHGFFLENNDESSGDINAQNRSANAATETENPLLRSGIALADANRRESGAKDDGILTALEASGLNLWGTKLVVLSACDTGIGDVKNGEGVYGLRRAFTLAGTESLVMSLWAVSDYATRELMIDYYKNLKNGTGRGESLRQVKLAMMRKKGREHPFYWAAFIQSGEWTNLERKR